MEIFLELLKEFGILVAAAGVLLFLTVWLVKTVMSNHFKMVERAQELNESRMDKVQEEAIKRREEGRKEREKEREEERKERAEIREAHQKSVKQFDDTVKNHMTHHTVAVEKLTDAVENLSGEIKRMDRGRR